MKKLLDTKSHKPAMLHTTACVISVDELLHIMSTTKLTGVDMSGLLDNHARAVAAISDAHIVAFINDKKHRARAVGGADAELAVLSRLAIDLRQLRDNYIAAKTVH